MSGRSVALALVAAAFVVLSSFGTIAETSRNSTSLPEATSPAPVTTDIVALPADAPTAPLESAVPITLTLSLGSPHPAALSAFLAEVDDPASPSYRHFLTYSQYLREYAPTAPEAASVVRALEAAGAKGVTVTPDRAGVSAVLPAAEVERLLGVSLVRYGFENGRSLYTAVGDPRLPAELQGLVVGIDGLSDRGLVAATARGTLASPVFPEATSPSSLFVHDNESDADWYVGSDYTQAYGATSLFPGSGLANATFPTHVAIATLLASGYNESTGQNLPPWDPSVVEPYFNQTFPASWPKPNVIGVPVTIGSVPPPMPGSFGASNDSTLDEFENSLDLEMAGSLAPGASIYNFYFAGSLIAGATPTDAVAAYFAETLSDALAYNYSPDRLAVVSGSFGLPDLNDSLWNIELGVAAATGVTVVTASGDQGNAPDSLTGRDDGPWPVWPATAAFNSTGAISVGGVTVGLGGTPTSDFNGTSLNLTYDPTVAGFTSMSTWYDAPPGGEVAGSEGGASTVFAEPWWQLHSAAQPAIVNATVVEGSGVLGRSGPDVAFPGNDTIATVVANATGAVFFTVLEGTSVAAPVLAGLLADVVAVESARSSSGWAPLGFLTPELYRIASYYAEYPLAPSNPFYDVVVGHNYRFSAAPGWDATTGWGGMNATRLLAADANASVRDYQYTGSTPGLPPPAAPSPSPLIPWTAIYLIFAVGLVGAVALILIVARAPRPRGPSGVPAGAHGIGPSPFGPGTQGGVYPGATFLCPYCGGLRPAEPVRCPQCGAF